MKLHSQNRDVNSRPKSLNKSTVKKSSKFNASPVKAKVQVSSIPRKVTNEFFYMNQLMSISVSNFNFSSASRNKGKPTKTTNFDNLFLTINKVKTINSEMSNSYLRSKCFSEKRPTLKNTSSFKETPRIKPYLSGRIKKNFSQGELIKKQENIILSKPVQNSSEIKIEERILLSSSGSEDEKGKKVEPKKRKFETVYASKGNTSNSTMQRTVIFSKLNNKIYSNYM